MSNEKPKTDTQIRDQKAKLFDIQLELGTLEQLRAKELQRLNELILQKQKEDKK